MFTLCIMCSVFEPGYRDLYTTLFLDPSLSPIFCKGALFSQVIHIMTSVRYPDECQTWHTHTLVLQDLLSVSILSSVRIFMVFFSFFLVEPEFELRTLHLQIRLSTAWASSPVHFALVILEMEFWKVLLWASLELWFFWCQLPK
jgi:hypothetical protein